MATKATEPKPKPKLVTVDSKIRTKYPWVDELATERKALALAERRKKECANGKQLSVQALIKLADEYEKLQKQINELVSEQEKIRDMMLLPHWGHTGIQEIESSLGKTLFVPAWSLGMDQTIVEQKLNRHSWMRNSERTLKPLSLIVEAENTAKFANEYTAIAESVRVTKFQIAILPPSSRKKKDARTTAPEEEPA